MIFWLSQIFFVFALINYLTAVSQKKKIFVMIFFTITNVFFGLHYLFLDKYSTLFLLSNETALLIVLAILEKYKCSHKYTLLACFVVFCLHIVAIVVTWTEALSLLPLSASMVFLFSLCFKGVLMTKICTLITNTIYITYLSLIGSYVAIACQCVLLIGAVIGLMTTIKYIQTKKHIAQKDIITPTILKRAKIEISHPKTELTLSAK